MQLVSWEFPVGVYDDKAYKLMKTRIIPIR